MANDFKKDSENNTISLAPFSCQYSSQVPELLLRLNCTIALSTYQAGKLIFLSPKDENSLVQLPRTFPNPMGLAEDRVKDKLALACKDEVLVFSNSPSLAAYYPKSPGKYDSMYLPRAAYFTGPLDIHDLSFGNKGELFAVNTLFSCIIKVSEDYSFIPYWIPSFIDEMVSEDRCHLNGMAMVNGLPKYVTAFNKGNSFQSWREDITKTGVVVDVESNEIVADGLAMPHTPRLFGKDLYVLLSAKGELVKIDVNTGKYDVVFKTDGFVRGMSLYRDYLFIGLSKLRKNSSTFGKLDFADKAKYSGIIIIHLPTGSVAGKITYLSSVDEIYDVHILSDKIRPNILNTLSPEYKDGLMTPVATYWAKHNDKI